MQSRIPKQMELRIMVTGFQEKIQKLSLPERPRVDMNYQVILAFIIYILEAFRGPD